MKTWLITGATRGLGLAVAQAALEAGDIVVATGRSVEELTNLLPTAGERVIPIAMDVTDDASVRQAVEQTLERLGRIDVLVNNAGYGLFGAFEEASQNAIADQFAVNVFGVFAVTRAVLPSMRARRQGRIITISSMAGVRPVPNGSLYCATKYAVTGWSESLSLELAPFGIMATVIHPGYFRTDFLDPSSLRYGGESIADYVATSAAARVRREERNHRQAGDPAKLGRVLVELANIAEPPRRFAAGRDAVQTIEEQANLIAETTREWRDLSSSTDVDQQAD